MEGEWRGSGGGVEGERGSREWRGSGGGVSDPRANVAIHSLVPRPLPDFIAADFFFPRLRDKIWEWPGDEASHTYL